MATNLAKSLGVTVIMSSVYNSVFVAAKAIDGNPKDVTGPTLVGTDCAATKSSLNPWLRVDLQKAYLVSRVRIIPIDDRGENVYVHVGNSLTNNGNGMTTTIVERLHMTSLMTLYKGSIVDLVLTKGGTDHILMIQATKTHPRQKGSGWR